MRILYRIFLDHFFFYGKNTILSLDCINIRIFLTVFNTCSIQTVNFQNVYIVRLRR